MPQGHFIVSPDPTDPQEIRFSIAPNLASPPADQVALKSEVESMLVILRTLYSGERAKFDRCYARILSAAQGGLVGPSAEPALAKDSLEALKRDIVMQEGSHIKNRYMLRLGKYSLAASLIFAVLAFLTAQGVSSYIPSMQAVSQFCYLLIGCFAGVWLSFGIRNVEMNFESLILPEREKLEPFMRIAFASVLAVIFGLMLSLEVVVISVGNISSVQFGEKLGVALLIGAFCGLSEQAMSDTITKKALSFVSGK